MRIHIFIAFLSFSCFNAIAQTPYFPGKTWQVKTAEELKMNRAFLDSAVQFAKSNENKYDNQDYGYMWWMNTSKKWPKVSTDLYYAAGAGGNYIVVDNKNDLLIVVRWMDDSKMDGLINLIEQSVAK